VTTDQSPSCPVCGNPNIIAVLGARFSIEPANQSEMLAYRCAGGHMFVQGSRLADLSNDKDCLLVRMAALFRHTRITLAGSQMLLRQSKRLVHDCETYHAIAHAQ
jgi:hypothetical protein